METINQTVFLWLNAPAHPDPLVMNTAVFFADWLVWLVPILVVFGWLRGDAALRKTLLVAVVSVCLGMLINQLIALLWTHPRPFMLHLGTNLLSHEPESSFPSDHLTFWWAFAFAFLLYSPRKRFGTLLAVLGLPLAWARVYLGVHFPLDMLGAALVAFVSAWLVVKTACWHLDKLHDVATRIHRRLFGSLIIKGWVHE